MLFREIAANAERYFTNKEYLDFDSAAAVRLGRKERLDRHWSKMQKAHGERPLFTVRSQAEYQAMLDAPADAPAAEVSASPYTESAKEKNRKRVAAYRARKRAEKAAAGS